MGFSQLINGEFLDYQESGIERALSQKYFCIGDEMGLGKTWQGIGCILELGKPALVVCPGGLRRNWKAELERAAKRDLVIDIISKPSDVFFPFDSDVVIISYDVNMLASSKPLFEWAEVVIADEIQKITNMDSGRGAMFHKLLFENQPEYYIPMSGTPIKNGVGEWYSILKSLYYKNDRDADYFNSRFPSKYEFLDTFCFSKKIRIRNKKDRYGNDIPQFATKYYGIRNKKELRKLLKDRYVRRLAKDYLELPELHRKNIIVSYNNDRALEEAWNNHQAGAEIGISAKAKSALVKASFTVSYCKDLLQETGGPILIFTDHSESCEKIAKGLKCASITGATSMKKRGELVSEFQRGKLDYLVCTIGSMKEGHTITRASNLVYNDKSWVPANNMQATKRIHRIGQNSRCMVHNIIGSKQDEHIQQLLIEKEAVLEEAL